MTRLIRDIAASLNYVFFLICFYCRENNMVQNLRISKLKVGIFKIKVGNSNFKAENTNFDVENSNLKDGTLMKKLQRGTYASVIRGGS